MKSQIVVLLFIFLFLISCTSTGRSTDNSDSCSLTPQRLGNDTFWVEVGRYGKASTKSLLIMPPTGGANFIDRRYANMFCKAGYEVFILMAWSDQAEDSIELTLHQRFYERSQKAIALALAEIKPGSSIGLLGTSVGALHSAVAASLQEHLNAVFIITGGAPLASVIVNSDQNTMVNLAKKRMDYFGFKSKEEYLTALSAAFKLEPMKLGEGYRKKKLGAVLALQDTTVPTEMQKSLVTYWKPQLVIEKDSGHFWAIVNTWLYNSDEILDFFEKNN